jgi:nucleoprotein TPR
VAYLESEGSERSKIENEKREKLTSKIFELEISVSDFSAYSAELAKQVDSLKDSLSLQNEKVDLYMSKLKAAESALVSNQNSFASEVDGLKRLNSLYARNLEEAAARIEELEAALGSVKESTAARLAVVREQLEKQVEKDRLMIEDERKQADERIRVLEQQLQEANSERTVLINQQQSRYSGNEDAVSRRYQIATIDEDLGITEIYDKVVHAERELLVERAKRKEAELYLQQILRDVEVKAPKIASERRDYIRIVESHTQLATKLDDAIVENSNLKETLYNLSSKTQEAVEQAALLEQHNADLSAQLQHLLKKSVFGGNELSGQSSLKFSSSAGVISDHLVKYDDVVELQTRNAQLLQVVRKLSVEQENRANIHHDEEKVLSSKALQSALSELQEMRNSRLKTEDLVNSLVQQRDMYRDMVEEFKLSPSTNNLLESPMQSAKVSFNDIQWKLTQCEDEKKRIQERMLRLEDGEKIFRESLDKIRAEANEARMEAAHSSSEARFQKERAERLEAAANISQQESNSFLQKRIETERTLLELQRELRNKSVIVSDLNEQIRIVTDEKRRAEIDKEVSRASENRINLQLIDCREEIKRYSSLIDHLHRIESGLKSRSEEEKETISRERDILAASYESLRKQIDEKSLIEDQRIKSMDDELRSLRSKFDLKTAELVALNESLIRESSARIAAHDRNLLLEKQLSIAQERLASSLGGQIVDALSSNDIAAKNLDLERCKAEIDALQGQLAVAEQHIQQFRNISVVTESSLKDLKQKSSESRAQLEEENRKLKEILESVQLELELQRSSAKSLMGEVEHTRQELRYYVILL